VVTRSRAGLPASRREPAQPGLPATIGAATLPEHDLEPEATYRGLGFDDLDLSGRSAESVEFGRCRLRRVDLSGSQLAAPRFTDCLVDTSNWANLHAERGALVRVRFTGSRMTGLGWAAGTLRDVTFDECRLDLSNWRFSAFRTVRFDRCTLTGADFTGADLAGARFVGCDLTGAHFDNAQLAGAGFRGCTYAGISGVASWRGASVHDADLIALSYVLAGAMGIQVEREDDRPDEG
jgi:uncharacterized protein YjbI with pentapeptide repeats